MNLVEYFNKLDTQNTSTEFSHDIDDYRILTNKYRLDGTYTDNTYKNEISEFNNKGYFIVTADREILMNNSYYWLGYLILDKNNKIINGIAIN
ncbi:conserved hypothetical protein [Clostridium neonatale]|uniref:hypothetical protein n=1 Tax=Clostridium neonatale TaxID=137838 RepID=UPI00291B74EA|nr:hypothetical protein [Clostridium neonatale]CAI3674028.1 conserved hypothetical protein [Clostridium neonatale]